MYKWGQPGTGNLSELMRVLMLRSHELYLSLSLVPQSSQDSSYSQVHSTLLWSNLFRKQMDPPVSSTATDVSVSVKRYFVHCRWKDSTVDNTGRGKVTDIGKKEKYILVKTLKISRCWNVRLGSNTHLEISEWSLSHWLALATDMFSIFRNKNGNTLWKSTTCVFVMILFTTALPMCRTQLLLVTGQPLVEASKVVDNVSHVSIDHVNKGSLDNAYDCKASQTLLPHYSQMPATEWLWSLSSAASLRSNLYWQPVNLKYKHETIHFVPRSGWPV